MFWSAQKERFVTILPASERIDQSNGTSKGKRDCFAIRWRVGESRFSFDVRGRVCLCQLLNEKYNNEAAKVDEEFRRSGLYVAHWIEKWERTGADTIEKTRKPPEIVIGGTTKQWTLEKFSSIVREEIDWIFQSYVARGKITGLSGEPGCGKSLITLDWAARFSSGRSWPDSAEARQQPGKVLVFATEDDAGDTILPRFIAGKPDNLLRIRLEGDTGFYFDDPKHLEILRIVTEQNTASEWFGMVIIDPILNTCERIKSKPRGKPTRRYVCSSCNAELRCSKWHTQTSELHKISGQLVTKLAE